MENLSFYQILKQTTLKYPNEDALYYENHAYSYKYVLNETNKLADALHNLGVKKYDVVTICMPNTPEAVYAFYAISYLGAICYEVHPKTTKTMMRRFLKESKSKVLIVLNIFANQYTELLDEMDLKIITCNPFEKHHPFMNLACSIKSKLNHQGFIPYHKLKYPKNSAKENSLLPTETSVYLNSGGTSGEPKIIELSSKAINALASQGTTILGITDPIGIYMLGVLPMFHGFGLCMGIHAPISFGACVSLMTKFSPKKTIELIKKKHCTIIIGVPGLFKSLLKQPDFYTEHLANLQVSYVGGDFVPEDLTNKFNETMEKFNSKARLYEGYGLTETVTVCNVNTDANHRAHSVGLPVGDCQNQIVDLKTRKPLAANEIGEICVSGSSLMNGYLHDEELTNKTFLIDENGTKWVLTGDYGYMDSDGYLYFKQRLKRVVKISGVIICPSDVENAVNKLDEVFEAYATDIFDESRGSMIKLFVTKNKNIKSTDEELTKKLKAVITEEVSVYASPKEIIYIDKMPKTDVGKIDSKYLESIK